jgi:hypothetical protein
MKEVVKIIMSCSKGFEKECRKHIKKVNKESILKKWLRIWYLKRNTPLKMRIGVVMYSYAYPNNSWFFKNPPGLTFGLQKLIKVSKKHRVIPLFILPRNDKSYSNEVVV